MSGADEGPAVTPSGGELRRNPVGGGLAVVAPARATRPADAAGRGGGAPPCPFCAGNEALTPPEVDAIRAAGSMPNGPGWRVRVVPNKYPALEGRHEVIVHAPGHAIDLEDLGDEALAEVLAMWQRRIAAQLDSGAAAVTLIGNLGAGSGASLEHPHEQLMATPVVPPVLLEEVLEAERYRGRYGTCVVCDEIAAAGGRSVLGDPFPAWVPAASRYNGELWLAPAQHQADFRAADPETLAPALRRLLTAIKASIDGAPLNFWLHTAPAELRGSFHWHLEFAPRTSVLAGFELGTGIHIVTKAPEVAAMDYRASLPPA
jgi:UDPglucose--hexose-1-phosphate uridylyltransferase